MRILIAEDELPMRTALVETLSAGGYHAYPSTRTIDNFIATLRSRIESDPANPVHLLTVRGQGYRLALDS